MNLHLAEIALMVAPGAHAVLLVDQAGWHLSARLVIPTNITILPMPPKSPELNPVENIAESGATRTPIPAQGGQHSGDCGQQVMAA